MKSPEITIKRSYKFGPGLAEGSAEMKPLLGGKGANLAEMSRIGLPVPPGFTITTDVCTEYHLMGKEKIRDVLQNEVAEGLGFIEHTMQARFGNPDEPLLVSVRSGARDSMPGMMDTVLDIGLNDEVVEGLSKKSGKPHFAWDSYRRFIQMYGDVVMKVNKYATATEDVFEGILSQLKKEENVLTDQDLSTEQLKVLVSRYKNAIQELTGLSFPQQPEEQLWNSIMAVFESWHTPRAIVYRKLNHLPDDWGTAVNVQAMVYGNMGNQSASGVAFTRDAATGENIFNGEYLIDAQGEDVVAGIRTPHQITREGSRRWARLSNIPEKTRKLKYASLEETMPGVFQQLLVIEKELEDHFRDMQDMEFTIQEGKLWILQTRNGKRTGEAMIRIGLDLLDEGMIKETTLLKRIDPNKVEELLHPVFDRDSLDRAKVLAQGIPASPGAASGQIVFNSETAVEWAALGRNVILLRTETSPEDLAGMDASAGILTARGGMTSHAAVVARGMGKCCISGAGELQIEETKKQVTIGKKRLKEGDWVSLNGSTGEILEGKIATRMPELSKDFARLIDMSERYARLKVFANADTIETARMSRQFGAEGIGLCRTEHMFFKDDRIMLVREMIMAEGENGRNAALKKILPLQRKDFEGILEVMAGLPVTIRLLDPPLHEFLPNEEQAQKQMATLLDIPIRAIREKVKKLSEVNPMLGHRGCRLGNTYPEITRMQARAIIEAAINLKRKGIKTKPEIMVPLTGTVSEFKMQADLVKDEIKNVFIERHDQVEYRIGTMMEVPRAILIADQLARHA
ncbi:MAG: pyruvate, phosphate dikinase, partial [Cyclobacteriaceae bacterium]|nr:pyruvate, phosphate dikinase [Cyclobacteriaceae bacterium]